MATLTVCPRTALADSPVWIHVSGLEPSQLVTLHALLVDEKGVKFTSRAFYQASAAGEVDLKEASALGGDYRGVWPMGLLCTLKSEEPLFQRLVKRDVMGSPFHIQITLLDGCSPVLSTSEKTLGTCTLERWYVVPGVERFPIKTGRVRGTLFLPPGNGPFPGLIDIFGGSGGLFEFRASLLASKGYAVLALAFFAYDDLQKTLEEVDLEYFEEAAILLLKHPKVRGPKLGVIGLSKGAEVALAMGTFLEQIAAVVCINGSTAMQGAPLRFRDIFIPAFPYKAHRILITNAGALSPSYVMTGPEDENYQNSAIPLERAQAHVLFVIGEDDQAVQSKVFAEAAIDRARNYGNNKVTLLSYPGAGHLIEYPGSPLSYMSIFRWSPRPNAWGGQAEPHARAQEDFWKKIQKFFEIHLGAVEKSSL